MINTDVDCSGVGFDGKDLFMTERAKIAWTHGFNICNNYLRRIRGPVNYESRLLKYVSRGFGIVDLEYGFYKEKLKKINDNFTKEDIQVN